MYLPTDYIDAWVLPLEQLMKLSECRQKCLVEEEMNLGKRILKTDTEPQAPGLLIV